MCKVKIKQFSEIVGLEKLYFCFIIDFTENVLHTKSHFPVQMRGKSITKEYENSSWSSPIFVVYFTNICGLYYTTDFLAFTW